VHLVFGARQTGRSTLPRKLPAEATVWLDFSRPAERAECLRAYADNIRLFIPVQEKPKSFLTTLPQLPFQTGSSLKRLKEMESFTAPGD
jgi:hypothetical protein